MESEEKKDDRLSISDKQNECSLENSAASCIEEQISVTADDKMIVTNVGTEISDPTDKDHDEVDNEATLSERMEHWKHSRIMMKKTSCRIE